MKIKKEGKVTIITFEEEITMESTLEIEENIKTLIKKGNKYLLFNLEKLKNLPSTSIRIFTSSVREINMVDGKLKICNMNLPIKRLFKSINLINVFSIHKSLENALDAF